MRLDLNQRTLADCRFSKPPELPARTAKDLKPVITTTIFSRRFWRWCGLRLGGSLRVSDFLTPPLFHVV
jgi:hypothetical protein